jgi:iron complex outermembrane recepter protein
MQRKQNISNFASRRLGLLAGSTTLILCISAPAEAQTHSAAAAPPPNAVEEVVVTAQRREETVNKVGMGIQAFKGAELQQLHITNTRDLGAVAPSFSIAQGQEGVPIYTLRGIGFNTINLSATSTVGTYTDEVAYAYPFMNSGPLFDLQRVEVLKGPQGTLYGRNTTGGLLDFITNKPSDVFGASVTAEVGNYSTHNFEGYVTGPLNDKIQGRLAFRTDDSDEGWQKSDTTGAHQGQVHRYAGRASLAIEPTSRLKIDLSLSGWYDGSDTEVAQVIGFVPATDPALGGAFSAFNPPGLAAYIASHQPTSDTQAGFESAAQRQANIGTGLGISGPLKENDQFYATKARIAYDISDQLRLVSLTGFNDLIRDAAVDWGGAPYELLGERLNGTIQSVSEDIHFEGDTDFGHWLVGGYYGQDKIHDGERIILGQQATVALVRDESLALLSSPFNTFGYTAIDVEQAFRTFSDIGDNTTTTWSVFADADWKLANALKLTTGLRYTDDRQVYSGCSSAFNGNLLPTENLFTRALYTAVYGGGTPPAPIAANGCVTYNPATNAFGPVRSLLDENNVSGRASLNWTPTAGSLIYASISRGAKAGDIPINAANIATQDAPARQEILTAYEFGTKLALFEHKVQSNVSLFYYDYHDKQVSGYFADPIYIALGRLVNVPHSEAYGVDGDVTWRMTSDLTVTGAATYLQTQIKNYIGINGAGLPQDFSGYSFPYSPTWQGSATLLYSHALTDSIGFQAALNGRFQSKSHADLGGGPMFDIKEYGLLNASIGLHSLKDRWEFSVWGRNLTDTYYWLSTASNAGTVVRFPGQPATFGASLTVKY